MHKSRGTNQHSLLLPSFLSKVSASYSTSSLCGTCISAVLFDCLLHLLWRKEKSNTQTPIIIVNSRSTEARHILLTFLATTIYRTSNHNYHALCSLQKPHRFPAYLWKIKWESLRLFYTTCRYCNHQHSCGNIPTTSSSQGLSTGNHTASSGTGVSHSFKVMTNEDSRSFSYRPVLPPWGKWRTTGCTTCAYTGDKPFEAFMSHIFPCWNTSWCSLESASKASFPVSNMGAWLT